MAIDKKQTAAQNRETRKDIREKIRLEDTYKREVTTLLLAMVKDFRQRYANTGLPTPEDEFIESWQESLTKHFKRVRRKFRNSVINNIDLDEDIITRDELEEIADTAFDNWTATITAEHAKIINDTTIRQMDDSVQEAIKISREEDTPTDNVSIALLAGVLLKRKVKGRIPSITMYETQLPAEKSKDIEATESGSAIRAARPTVIVPLDTKTWLTRNDSKVRPTHMALEGTTIDINQNFIVGGSSVRFPGDGSLGAALKEIINCRCRLQYNINGRLVQ